ncbi:thiamine-phosphate kinase [Arcanobacterium haemolyticum]
MRVQDLNEAELLARFTPLLPQAGCAVVPNGDDSVVLDVVGHTTVSTDMLIEDRHFRLEWSTGRDVGYRAAQQNIADALAMGARPVSLVVGLGLPPETPVAWVEDFARGLNDACAPLGVGVDGGDLVASPQVSVGVTIIGDLEGRSALLRSGALPGQRVVFAGSLGHGLAGYELLQAGYDRNDPDSRIVALIDDFLRPKPPVEIALAAARSGVLCSLMDVSDGLAKDLGRIARASRVWVDLDAPALNTLIGSLGSAAGRLGADRRYWALAGGEDHGFVGTIAADGAVPAGFTVIGEVRGPAEHGRLTLDLADIDSDRIGWDHFRQ